MILYFSGTGNSKYTAEIISKVTNDEVVSIGEKLKQNKKQAFSSQKPYVFVVPSYCNRIPNVVTKFIQDSTFTGAKEVYFIITCSETIGEAEKHIKKLSKQKEFKYMGLEAVAFPCNYIIMYELPQESVCDKMVEDAEYKIKEIASKINNNENLIVDESLCGLKLASKIAPLFYAVMVKDKPFYTTDKCIGCGKCEQKCPLNNIKIVDKKPQWQGNCTHCMACISLCPQKAIEYKNKTENRRKYYNKKITL